MIIYFCYNVTNEQKWEKKKEKGSADFIICVLEKRDFQGGGTGVNVKRHRNHSIRENFSSFLKNYYYYKRLRKNTDFKKFARGFWYNPVLAYKSPHSKNIVIQIKRIYVLQKTRVNVKSVRFLFLF